MRLCRELSLEPNEDLQEILKWQAVLRCIETIFEKGYVESIEHGMPLVAEDLVDEFQSLAQPILAKAERGECWLFKGQGQLPSDAARLLNIEVDDSEVVTTVSAPPEEKDILDDVF